MESFADKAEPLPLGHVLAEERERQGLSRVEIAQRLHMSAYQVEALENGDFSRLPKGTFLRGFVRNYAKLLGLESDVMLSRLAEGSPKAQAPGIVVPTQNIRFDPIGARLSNPYVKASVLAFVMVLVGFAGMYWWVAVRPTTPAALARKAAPEPGRLLAPVPQNLAAAPVPPPDPVVMRQAPITAEVEREPPRKVLPVAASAPGSRLKFRFKGSSWIEIKDGRGKVLLARLNEPGSEAEVSGRPPFTVVVGNAPEVRMTFNDREFPLEPHTKIAVARFTVE